MLDIVISKHAEIVNKMAELETVNLYNLEWEKLSAQRIVLNELLKEYDKEKK